MIDPNNPSQISNTLQRLVAAGKFQFVSRKDRTKSPITAKLARLIVPNLTVDDFQKSESDHNGSNDLIFVFISDDGARYYIKFKFINDTTAVKFFSFHEAVY